MLSVTDLKKLVGSSSVSTSSTVHVSVQRELAELDAGRDEEEGGDEDACSSTHVLLQPSPGAVLPSSQVSPAAMFT